MKFEHLIEINDPLNPLADLLTRHQLWLGLMLRAQAPMLFVPHLDECTILERRPDGLARRLRYGKLVIHDRVTFEADRSVTYHVAPQKDIAASLLVMRIEDSPAGALFVRFEYDDGQDAATDQANAMYNEFRRSAYVESDIDTISMIRQLAQEGGLEAGLQ